MTDSSPPNATAPDDAPAAASTAPIEHWERDLDVPAWLCVLVRVLHRWPTGRVLTGDEYAAGLERARALVLG